MNLGGNPVRAVMMDSSLSGVPAPVSMDDSSELPDLESPA